MQKIIFRFCNNALLKFKNKCIKIENKFVNYKFSIISYTQFNILPYPSTGLADPRALALVALRAFSSAFCGLVG